MSLNMFNRSMSGPMLRIIQYKNAAKHINSTKRLHSCICGQIYLHGDTQSIFKQNVYVKMKINHMKLLRAHSTQSDQHRQKMVIETQTPKDVLDKLEEKLLSDAKISKDGSIKNKLGAWKNNMEPYVKLMRLDKPIGIWLLYWPCTWSIALGAIDCGAPWPIVIEKLGLFFVGAVVMRGAGCTINDLWDRDIDAKVERTKNRPLVSGAVTEKQAIAFLAAQLSVGLAVLLQLNWFTIALGASSLGLVVSYPLAKRVTSYPQVWLGLTMNWGAWVGHAALAGHAPAALAPLYLGACAWTLLYDTIYALQDKVDDARIGVKSTALTFSSYTKGALSAAAAAATCLLAAAGALAGGGLEAPYYVALACAATHAGHQIYTLKPDCPSDCAKKFKSNTWIGLIIFLGIVAGGYSEYKEKLTKNKEKYKEMDELE